VSSIYLWGCYTGDKQYVQPLRDVLPRLKLIFGFSGVGPSGSLVQSGEQLAALMKKETEIGSARDLKEAVEKMGKINKLGTNLVAVVGWCYVGVNGAGSMLQDRSRCPAAMARVSKEVEKIYRPYFEARGKGASGSDYSDPPADTSLSTLRSFYDDLQSSGDCVNTVIRASAVEIPPIQEIKFLIFFKNVEANFHRQFRSDIAEIDRLLKAAGQPLMPDLSLSITTLAQVMHWFQTTKQFEYADLLPPGGTTVYTDF